MFEGMRSKLVKRLQNVGDRFEDIEVQALEYIEESKFALRAGISEGENIPLYNEVFQSARDQRQLVIEARRQLLLDGALPLIYLRGVRRAEKFANQCEYLLNSIDLAKSTARQASRKILGRPQ